MRKLYLRFFLSFWGAMVLVLAGTVAATLWLASERMDHERERQQELAREAQAVLAGEGVLGLHDWLVRQVSALSPDRLYLLDSHGHDMLERPVPESLQAALGRRPYPQQGLGGRPDYRLISQLVSAPTGETFALSLLRRREGLFRVWGPFASPEVPVFAVFITLLVSAVVCYLLARFLSAPINHLRAATHSIADGNLGVHVAGLLGRRRDELALLAVDFDAMTARLRALLESNQQLLRDVSHELRSPLARLQIALGLARRPGADLNQELDRIERDAQRLDELIGEILSLSRLDDAAQGLKFETLALGELLEDICEDARVESEPRGIVINLQYPADQRVRGDRELLHRAIENVLRNAVRFSPDGGQIQVSAQPAADHIAISVRDQGPGVPVSLLQRIFEPFYRVDSARDRDSGGNGIGLAIAARVLNLHQGSIGAENVVPHGLQVSMLLPAALRGATG
jgi:two-component system sensor histidine kinase CpxA